MRKLRTKKIASEQDFLLRQPKHGVIRALGAGGTDDLELHPSKHKSVCLPIRNSNGGLHAAVTHHRNIRPVLPCGHPGEKGAIPTILVGLQFTQVALLLDKVSVRNDFRAFFLPESRATDMICVGMTQDDIADWCVGYFL